MLTAGHLREAMPCGKEGSRVHEALTQAAAVPVTPSTSVWHACSCEDVVEGGLRTVSGDSVPRTLRTHWQPCLLRRPHATLAHLLGRAAGWDISLTRTAPGRWPPPPARPAQPHARGSPGPRRHRRSSHHVCRDSSCPRGPSYIPLWSEGETDRQTDIPISWQGVLFSPRQGLGI